MTYISELYQQKDLLLAWTTRNIRARYQQSVVGWLWAVLQPAAQVALFTVVFTMFVPIDTGNVPYPVFSYVAIVPWTFLSASLPDMTDSLVANMGLVTKIYFPREILPISAMLARMMDFAVAACLLVILMLIYRMPVFTTVWLAIPVILATQMALILGIGLACAALNVFFRDVRSLLALGLQLWFYASPIIYPVTTVPEQLRPYYFLNPMAGVIEAYRDVLIYGRLPGTYLVPSALVAVVVFISGYWFFRRVEFQFADIV